VARGLRKQIADGARRVVVKLGSSVLAGRSHGAGEAETEALASLVGEVHLAKKQGREMAIVSSGAVAMGMRSLNLKARPVSIPERQAVAAVGQGRLMTRYDALFREHGERVAQVLLTHDDLSSRKRFLNARNTIFTLFEFGIIPIINENDTVAVEEIKFGDNDTLAALATNLVEADLLVILTDIDGLFNGNPRHDLKAERIAFNEDEFPFRIRLGVSRILVLALRSITG